MRKRWIYLLPAVFVTYSLAYLDRANYGFGAAAGLAKTLKITGNQASLLAGLFFVGYVAFQIPGAMLARRYSIRGVVFASLGGWGVCAALTGVVHRFWLLAVDRALLGVAESVIMPVMLQLLARWFTRAERSRANAILVMGNPVTVLWMSVITGWLISRFGWQMTFVLEGLPSIVWAGVWVGFIRDQPREAKWLTPEAAAVLEQRLLLEQSTIRPVKDLRAGILRADTLLLSVQFFFWSLGVYGLVFWLPTIVHEGAGVSMTKTGLLAAIPYIGAIAGMLLVSVISDQTDRRKSIIWPPLLLSGFAMLGSFLTAPRSFTIAFICLVVSAACMYAPYGPFFAMISERLPSNVSGEAMALVNTCGALGGFCGSYLVGLLEAKTGTAQMGYLLMSFSLVLSATLTLLLKDPAPAGNDNPSKCALTFR